MMVSWYPYLFYYLLLLYVLFLVKSKIEKKPGYLDTIEFLQEGFWYPGIFSRSAIEGTKTINTLIILPNIRKCNNV
jgi:hypothetical protein